ncbi:BAG domain-containing protein Samui-like [Dicentrarchus labrax]|uniref:Glycosyl hydrolases family 22 (GH22) domain-containing protein n=1 Tax=Dicentrarchus labrax TaxID=13489 RepID=A0A8C4HC39_DICLA|nr:BAG domain-containing protein Samui-like [Dicentrarchus labrax]
MKLGLLVVLAVAVLVPSLSESRTVSRCELREKLGEALILSKRLERFRERILAIVICQVERRSRLNTALVRVFGKRRTTTAKPTTVVTDPTTPRVTETTHEPTTTVSVTTIPTTQEPTTQEPTTPQPTTQEPTTQEPTTQEPTTQEPTTPQPTTQEPTTQEPTTEATTTVSVTTVPRTNTTRSMRRKREADVSEEDMSFEEMLEEEENKFDEEEMENDNNKMEDEDEDEDEVSNEVESDEQEEDGKRNKRSARRWKPKKKLRPWSLGFYGLFQLSDSYFCNSGYRWSKNACGTSCDVFTDDDITDDVECFMKTNYFWAIIRNTPRKCLRTAKFFAKCE